jgi:hypothetical protein
MNRNGLAFCVVVAGLMLPLTTSAQKDSIYSWTDENGVRHYSDTAPAEAKAEVEQIPIPQSTAPAGADGETLNNEIMAEEAAAPGTADPSAGTGQELSYADQQRQAMEEKRQARRESQAERERICLQARDQLARIEPSRRVFYTDEAGNTTRLDDEQRVQMVEDNKKLVDEYCD